MGGLGWVFFGTERDKSFSSFVHMFSCPCVLFDGVLPAFGLGGLLKKGFFLHSADVVVLPAFGFGGSP